MKHSLFIALFIYFLSIPDFTQFFSRNPIDTYTITHRYTHHTHSRPWCVYSVYTICASVIRKSSDSDDSHDSEDTALGFCLFLRFSCCLRAGRTACIYAEQDKILYWELELSFLMQFSAAVNNPYENSTYIYQYLYTYSIFTAVGKRVILILSYMYYLKRL